MEKRTICVYCASSSRVSPRYLEEARSLGEMCAGRGYDVVCGGGVGGLMARLIDGVVKAGGHVTGVLPRFMVERQWNHGKLSETVIVETMHERKARMLRDADLAIALPGGIGTFEELLEAITWRQLGLYTGEVAIMNIDGYYDPLLRQLQAAEDGNFMRHRTDRLWSVVTDSEEALALIK